MIVLDNSVLSAFKRLELLNSLKTLIPSIIISKKVCEEYSLKWKENLPSWLTIEISDQSLPLPNAPMSLSRADLSVLRVALTLNSPVASDDLPLRSFAKKMEIPITGSLGLLKSMYDKKIIAKREKYIKLIDLLCEDIYISDDLKRWAMEK